MFGGVAVGRFPSLSLVDGLSPRHICVALIRFSEFLKRKRVGYEVWMEMHRGRFGGVVREETGSERDH